MGVRGTVSVSARLAVSCFSTRPSWGGGEGLLIHSQTRPLQANEGTETTREGTTSTERVSSLVSTLSLFVTLPSVSVSLLTFFWKGEIAG